MSNKIIPRRDAYVKHRQMVGQISYIYLTHHDVPAGFEWQAG
jgi:hypothetical protein